VDAKNRLISETLKNVRERLCSTWRSSSNGDTGTVSTTGTVSATGQIKAFGGYVGRSSVALYQKVVIISMCS